MIKYLLRLLIFVIIAFFTWSVGTVVVYKYVPVTVTPLKVIRFFQNFPEAGFHFSSKWVPIENINPSMIRAVISTEDNNFVEHYGIDYDAIKMAIKDNRKGKRLRGGSTISQQTAKNVFCLPSRTWIRKGFETWYTLLIELIWGKKRIMEVYLNVIETGVNVYGVQGAAQKFYKKDAEKLNTYEASMIAAALPNPRVRNIGNPSSYMVSRASQIRVLMRKIGPIEFD
jgi:monofunctional biosynthetic peptidoglycan transglycosylase